MKCIDEIPVEELRGKRVLVRAGLDLSLDEYGEANDLFRVTRACPTIEYLKKAGAKVVILSHIGRDPSQTNAPVAKALSAFMKVSYVPDLLGALARSALAAMVPGDVVLLENLRQYYDLEKAADEQFGKQLAALGEVYVGDAFSNAHRAHASMVVVPKCLPHYAGLLLRDEVAHLSEALRPPKPSFVIIGGAKFETKSTVIESFLKTYDHVFVVGAIANDVLRVRGIPVGLSKVSEYAPSKEIAEHQNLLTVSDVTVETPDGHARVKNVHEIASNEMVVDMGPDSVATVAPLIAQASFILWNGTTGVYENGYLSYTEHLARLIAARVAEGGKSVIGGGDTIAALDAAHVPEESLGFLSTGGGAMLDFFANGTLPAINALNQ